MLLGANLKKFGLPIYVGVPGGKRTKTEAVQCPVQEGGLYSGGTLGFILDCSGVVSFTYSHNNPCSILHHDI